MTRKPITIHYRKFSNDANPGKGTLENFIKSAMACKINGEAISAKYPLRIMKDNGYSVFINIYDESNDAVFGDLIMFSPGEMQSIIDESDQFVPIAKMEQLPPPAQKEYVKSQMFWYIRSNHVFLIQSMSLKSDSIEKYLTWLLSQKTATVKDGPGIILVSKFDPAAVGGDLEDIRQVVVGGSIAKPIDVPEQLPEIQQGVLEVIEKGQIERAGIAGWQKAKEILLSLLGGEADVNRIMDAVPPEAELSVSVSIGFKSKKRKNISRAALRDLEVGLRNLPDSELSVIGKGGKKSPDGQLRLQHLASIKLMTFQDGGQERAGSLLDPNDVIRAMSEAYNIFVSNGKIL